jgi:hypothetical protein
MRKTTMIFALQALAGFPVSAKISESITDRGVDARHSAMPDAPVTGDHQIHIQTTGLMPTIAPQFTGGLQ